MRCGRGLRGQTPVEAGHTGCVQVTFAHSVPTALAHLGPHALVGGQLGANGDQEAQHGCGSGW